jgi:hypothetical protein
MQRRTVRNVMSLAGTACLISAVLLLAGQMDGPSTHATASHQQLLRAEELACIFGGMRCTSVATYPCNGSTVDCNPPPLGQCVFLDPASCSNKLVPPPVSYSGCKATNDVNDCCTDAGERYCGEEGMFECFCDGPFGSAYCNGRPVEWKFIAYMGKSC